MGVRAVAERRVVVAVRQQVQGALGRRAGAGQFEQKGTRQDHGNSRQGPPGVAVVRNQTAENVQFRRQGFFFVIRLKRNV